MTLFQYEFDNMTYPEALQAVQSLLKRPGFHFIVTLNPEIILMAEKNTQLASYLHNASLTFADGTGLLFANRLLNRCPIAKITGSDLTPRLLSQPYRVYFLGAKPAVVAKAVELTQRRFPACQIVGFHHGYFKSEEEPAIMAELQALKPDIVFVGLGAPKQEAILNLLKDTLSYGVGIGIGGVFDILSDTKKRAPVIFQKMGLEWLFRGLIEPSRIKRWLFIPKFIVFTIKNMVKI